MASNINPFNIDGTYPIAGQDNDSQGFRDNFTNIRNNFSYSKTELEDLQAKAVLKSALIGTTLDNNFSGALLTAAQVRGISASFVDNSAGNATLDFLAGNVQKITTNGSISLDFTNWPTSGTYGSILVWINVATVTDTVTISPVPTIAADDVAGLTAGVLSFDTVGDYLYEISTVDGGTTVLVTSITQAPNKIHGNVTITGNLISSGGRIESGYQYDAPTTGATVTVSVGKSRVVLDPAATISTLTVTLPTGTGLEDGTIIDIGTTAQVTTLTVSSGSTVKPSATYTLYAGTGVQYFWHKTESTWYKLK